MNKENKYQSRISFLKKVPLAILSISSLSFIGFNFNRLQRFLGNNTKTISLEEANEHLRSVSQRGVKQVKPESPPKIQQQSNGSLINEI